MNSTSRIAEGAALVARWHKQFIRRLTYATTFSRQEWAEGFVCFESADYKEGVAAFLAKRAPNFSGK